jgi:hypothetical protein
MARQTFGKLPPRYSFMLNPYVDFRASKCPKCDRLTHRRKFPLLILIREYGPLVLGKTCRYCTPCEMIIAHKDELDAELAHSLAQIAPKAVGNEYLVAGTMDRKVWQQGLRGAGIQLDASLEHLADFKHVFDLEVTGGWGRA